jgi:hypothetical protein
VGRVFWIEGFTFVFILVLAIVMTYKIVQATADETDYGQELYYDSWGPR